MAATMLLLLRCKVDLMHSLLLLLLLLLVAFPFFPAWSVFAFVFVFACSFFATFGHCFSSCRFVSIFFCLCFTFLFITIIIARQLTQSYIQTRPNQTSVWVWHFLPVFHFLYSFSLFTGIFLQLLNALHACFIYSHQDKLAGKKLFHSPSQPQIVSPSLFDNLHFWVAANAAYCLINFYVTD